MPNPYGSAMLRARQNMENNAHHDPEKSRIKITPTALGLLIPLFLLCVIGPVVVIFMVRRTRRAALAQGTAEAAVKSAKRPLWSREDARQELQYVVEAGETKLADANTSEKLREGDEESVYADKLVSDGECAICLCHLSAPSAPPPALLRSASQSSLATEKPGISADSPENLPQTQPSPETDIDSQEILRLQVCKHQFHMECLISWFVLRKYSCPICRAVYYKSKDTVKSETSAGGEGNADMDVEAQARTAGTPDARNEVNSRQHQDQSASTQEDRPRRHGARGLMSIFVPINQH